SRGKSQRNVRKRPISRGRRGGSAARADRRILGRRVLSGRFRAAGNGDLEALLARAEHRAGGAAGVDRGNGLGARNVQMAAGILAVEAEGDALPRGRSRESSAVYGRRVRLSRDRRGGSADRDEIRRRNGGLDPLAGAREASSGGGGRRGGRHVLV